MHTGKAPLDPREAGWSPRDVARGPETGKAERL